MDEEQPNLEFSEGERQLLQKYLAFYRLLFAREVATYIRERVWHRSRKMLERRDGALEFRLRTSSRKELTRWILSWMPHVKVLGPSQLQDRVRERILQGLALCR